MTAPTAFSALVNKLTMPAMFCVAMTYEALCATFRAAAAVENIAYVPYTILDYFELLNRPVNLANAVAVGVSTEPLPAGKMMIPSRIGKCCFDYE